MKTKKEWEAIKINAQRWLDTTSVTDDREPYEKIIDEADYFLEYGIATGTVKMSIWRKYKEKLRCYKRWYF